jgi:succinate dehydrogenase/fumarate reductase flavoprotein subunit
MIRSYNLELKEAFEAENLLELAEIFIEMALMKRESRGTFRRLDYPEESDTFTSVRVKLVNGKREYRVIKVPIPLE